MADNDPFGDSNSEPEDVERTIILPAPGGRRRNPGETLLSPKPLVPEPAAGGGGPVTVDSASQNSLVRAAAGPFALIRRLSETLQHADVAGLRDSVITMMQGYEGKARGYGASAEAAHAARYALCSLIDETVLATPWGSHSVWSEQTVLATMHNETSGGERFFQIVSRMSENAARNIDLLEFLYLCLSLGFKGKFAVMDRGSSQLEQITVNLYRTIANQKGEAERDLSPHWRGVADGRPRVGRFLPLWVVPVVACAIAVMVYFGFSYLLNSESDGTFTALNKLHVKAPELRKAAVTEPFVPKPIVISNPTAPPTPYQKIKAGLEDEIGRGLLAVADLGNSVKITVHNKGMFGSGRATVTERFRPLIRKIGSTVSPYPGPYLVTGHSDNVPIRTVRFQSNWKLSEARASAVASILAESVGNGKKVDAEGRSSMEPLQSNATAEGRERNRRVEIKVPVK